MTPASPSFPPASWGHFFSISFRHSSPFTCSLNVAYSQGSVLATILFYGWQFWISYFHFISCLLIYLLYILATWIYFQLLGTRGLFRQELENEGMIPVIRRSVIFPFGLDIGSVSLWAYVMWQRLRTASGQNQETQIAGTMELSS